MPYLYFILTIQFISAFITLVIYMTPKTTSSINHYGQQTQ